MQRVGGAGRQEKAQLFPEHAVGPAHNGSRLQGYPQVRVEVARRYVAHLDNDSAPTAALLAEHVVQRGFHVVSRPFLEKKYIFSSCSSNVG